MLRSNPGFTAVAVLMLALGIASNTTVFSWIDSVLLRPIPGALAAGELAVQENITSGGEFIKASYPDYRDYRDSLRLISGLTAVFSTPVRIGDREGGREIWGQLVTGNYFHVLGVRPLLGRFFTPEEAADPPASFPVMVVSYDFWQTQLGGDRGVIGRTLRVNRRTLTIVGVAPQGFRGSTTGVSNELWIPLTMIYQLNRADDGWLSNRGTRALDVIARLKPGVTIEQARAEIVTRSRELAAANPRTNEGIGVALVPVAEAHLMGAQFLLRRPLHILMAVCIVVLLIVCANVANLLLAQATARQKEFGIRLALGAQRSRIARQLLTENLLVAGAGALVGILCTPWIAGSLVWLLPPVNVPVRLDATLNGRVLAWTVLVSIFAALLSGMAPLLCTLRPELSETLKEGGRGGKSGARAHRTRGLLVISEVALAAVALIGAGLFLKSFHTVRAIHPGFDTNHVVVARFPLADTGLPIEQQQQFCLRLRERLERAPGMESVSYADVVPMAFDGGPWWKIEVEGYVPATGENMIYYRSLVAPGYFGLLRIPLLEGRDFTAADEGRSPLVMIVNETFARRFFKGANPIGRKVRTGNRWYTVVGVAKNIKYHNLAEPPVPYFYAPFLQRFSTGLNALFYLRTAGDPAAAISLLRREAAAVDATAEVTDAMPLAESIGQSLYPLKVAASLLSVLGALAVALAALGLYSVMAYAVSQRTQEVGIRMALGARPTDVLGMMVRQGLLLTAAGLAAGMAAAIAASRLVRGMLMNVSAADPAAFAGAALFLALVAMLASYVPARRATRVDPMIALRCE